MHTSSTPQSIRHLYVRSYSYLLKIPLFAALYVGLIWTAYGSDSIPIRAACYFSMGYLLMSFATFLHDCTHNSLFLSQWKNWLFGILGFTLLVGTFVSYREDHLLHHRENRSPTDTAAFTMGKRSLFDFIVFYFYSFFGILILIPYFTVAHALISLRGWKFWLHWAELALHIVAYTLLFTVAAQKGVLPIVLEITLWPLMVFGILNSMRFLAEHHGTPWDQGQLAGTRTIISNPVHSWFWNNINYHIGHHIYPSVPSPNLVRLHETLQDRIEKEGGVVEQSTIKVFLRALYEGPETPETAARKQEMRKAYKGISTMASPA